MELPAGDQVLEFLIRADEGRVRGLDGPGVLRREAAAAQLPVPGPARRGQAVPADPALAVPGVALRRRVVEH
jgi:hypothetical protein